MHPRLGDHVLGATPQLEAGVLLHDVIDLLLGDVLNLSLPEGPQ